MHDEQRRYNDSMVDAVVLCILSNRPEAADEILERVIEHFLGNVRRLEPSCPHREIAQSATAFRAAIVARLREINPAGAVQIGHA